MDKIEKMFSLVDQYRSSGLSIKVFSEQNNIKRPTFIYWIQKKKQSEKKDNIGNFLPINLPAPKVKNVPIEILYPNGVKILLDSPDKEQVREYINLLGC